MTNTPPSPSPTDVMIEPDNEVWNPAPADDCPFCGGLNISCPLGCERDPKTGELLPVAPADDLVERLPKIDVVRDLASLPSSRRLEDQVNNALLSCADWIEDAATRIQSDAEKIAELEALHRNSVAVCMRSTSALEAENATLEARVKTLREGMEEARQSLCAAYCHFGNGDLEEATEHRPPCTNLTKALAATEPKE